jgi:hypothetical protein
MKTLINVDSSVLIDYDEYKSVNKDWNITSYLNTFYDLNTAIAFSKFYFPDFIEVSGCIILACRYNEEIFMNWFKELKGDIVLIEKMCNLYELKDFFHINTSKYSEEEYDKSLNIFGVILKKSWEINLKSLYPNKTFHVQLFEEENSKFITIYSSSLKIVT